jgi:hypothetical protein
MVLLALSMPVVSAYVVPGLGTNWLRLWEFTTRLRLGRFRLPPGALHGLQPAVSQRGTQEARHALWGGI